jgi:hypothetical protein
LKVLLVSVNTETINMPVLPLGLGYVAAATQIAGYDIKLLNLLDQNNSLSLLKRTVHEFRPDVIGISVMNIDDPNMERPRFLLGPVKTHLRMPETFKRHHCFMGAGYSIFTHTDLADTAVKQGLISADDSLLYPKFYLNRTLEKWQPKP